MLLSTVVSGVRQYLRAGKPETVYEEVRSSKGPKPVERSVFLTPDIVAASDIEQSAVGQLLLHRRTRTHGAPGVKAQLHPYYGKKQHGRPLYIRNDATRQWVWTRVDVSGTSAKFQLSGCPDMWLGVRDGFPTLVPAMEAAVWTIHHTPAAATAPATPVSGPGSAAAAPAAEGPTLATEVADLRIRLAAAEARIAATEARFARLCDALTSAA